MKVDPKMTLGKPEDAGAIRWDGCSCTASGRRGWGAVNECEGFFLTLENVCRPMKGCGKLNLETDSFSYKSFECVSSQLLNVFTTSAN